MKTTHSKRTAALAVLGAAAVLLAPITMHPALAQGGFGGGPGGGFGGPGGGGQGRFGGGGPGGGQGGFNRRPPFAYGTVTAVDSGAGTITIAGRGGGADQTIQTQGTTQIVSQAAASVSDLKKGDTIQVQGVPTGITASSVSIGQSPLSSLGGPGGPGGGFGGPGGGGPGGPGAGGPGAPAPAIASATGTVTGTSPLTISLSSTASMTLKMDPNAKVTKYTPVTLSTVKVGDRVLAMGTANDDGSFAATTVALNLDPSMLAGLARGGGGYGRGGGGGFGRGGRGGGPNGGGGFGGPGGGGPGGGGMPQNGFGGPGGPGAPPPGQ